MESLAGKTAWVTGATRGIGAAVASCFAASGARVAAFDRDAVEVPADDANWLSLQGDVSNSEDVQAAVDGIENRFGGLDLVVNCAGILRDHVLWKMSDADWQAVIDVNLTGSFKVLRAAVPLLRKTGGGSIVLVASVNGQRGSFGQSNYSASKAGVIALTRTVAREVGAFGIRVNAVAPGMVDTDMTRSLPDYVSGEARKKAPLQRVADPDEIARVARFLCSDDASYITGEVLRVDGGLLA